MVPFKLSKNLIMEFKKKKGVMLLGKDLKPTFLFYSAGVVLCQNIRNRSWNTVLKAWINGQNLISNLKIVGNLQSEKK